SGVGTRRHGSVTALVTSSSSIALPWRPSGTCVQCRSLWSNRKENQQGRYQVLRLARKRFVRIAPVSAVLGDADTTAAGCCRKARLDVPRARAHGPGARETTRGCHSDRVLMQGEPPDPDRLLA